MVALQGVVKKAGAISFAGILPGSGNELGGAGAGHKEKIEHVGCTGSTEMRVAEALGMGAGG